MVIMTRRDFWTYERDKFTRKKKLRDLRVGLMTWYYSACLKLDLLLRSQVSSGTCSAHTTYICARTYMYFLCMHKHLCFVPKFSTFWVQIVPIVVGRGEGGQTHPTFLQKVKRIFHLLPSSCPSCVTGVYARLLLLYFFLERRRGERKEFHLDNQTFFGRSKGHTTSQV